MDFFKHVIVGSGPAGVAAARHLERDGLCMVDAGVLPSVAFPYATRRDALSSGDAQALLGAHWEMLGNVVRPGSVHAKLRSPGTAYVARGEQFPVLDGAGRCLVRGAGSYAAGGMSNAWGAQLLRYTDADLQAAGDWPISAAELESHYAELEAHIGISGVADDMHDFLGGTAELLPPTPLVPAARHLLDRYEAQSRRHGARDLRLGRARVGLLTRPHRGYEPYAFGETEFFSTEQCGIYTARRSLQELVTGGNMTYLGGHRLVAYREAADHVEIDLQASDGPRTIRAKNLLLGCGTVHTARLVLLNRQAHGLQLPFMDHPPTLLPLFLPRMFGSTLPEASSPIQLVATLGGMRAPEMISFYYPGALLRSDILGDMPLPLNAALDMLPHLLGGMLVAQIWEASRPQAGNALSVDADGAITINYPHRTPYAGMARLLPLLRQLGALSLSRLASSSPPGWGFHYAGCLPMRAHPRPFETHVDGRLWDSRRVRVIDGSVLPSLPAKNHSLTLMANAGRIAREVLQCAC